MKNKFNTLINYFIHPQLKVDKSLHERSTIYVLAFTIVFFMGLFYTIFYLSQNSSFDLKAFHNYLGISVGIIGLTIIKKTGKTDFALLIGAIIGGYLITASVYLSGGIKSNDVLWYAVLAAATFMFIGAKSGIVISILSIGCLTMYFILDFYSEIKFNTNTVASSLEYSYFNLVLILGVLSFMVYILVRGNTKLQKIIRLSKEQKMREEIARDFHDQIGNKLASLMHLAELMKIKKNHQEREEIVSKIDLNSKYVYDNFRDFIWTLDAKSDQLVEMFMYLRDFADDYFKFSDIKIYITSTPDQLPEITLPSHYSKEIIPLFKEAITNIYKHAKATKIEMNFIVTNMKLSVVLKDDGCGIDEGALKKGNGLVNMKHRADKTGGELFFLTSSNNGTEIIYTVFLPAENIF